MDGKLEYGRYHNAERFFGYVRSKLKSLDSARARLEEERTWIRALRYDDANCSSGIVPSESSVERSVQALMEAEEAYAGEIAEAQNLRRIVEDAIDAMQRDNADAPGDADVLRRYYLLGWKTGRVTQRLHYNVKYIPDKRAVALMHVAPYVPLDW